MERISRSIASPGGRILISSRTYDPVLYLLNIKDNSTVYIRYVDSKTAPTTTKFFLRHHFQLASINPLCKRIVVEGIDAFCPKEDANEAVLEEMVFWLGKTQKTVVGLASKSVAPLIVTLFAKRFAVPSSLDYEDRLFAIKLITKQHSISMDDQEMIEMATCTNGLGFEDLISSISDRRPIKSTTKAGTNRWKSVVGQEAAKVALIEASKSLWDEELRTSYRSKKISPVIGILMYGPPGTGKTLLAKALASHCSAHFFSVTIPDLVHAEIGKSEQSLAALFARASAHQPAIIFIDELDAIFSSPSQSDDQHTTGRKLLGQLFIEFDRIHRDPEARILVVGATNNLAMLDPALLRFGRFEKTLEIAPEPGYTVAVNILLNGFNALSPSIVDGSLLDADTIGKILETRLRGRSLSGAEAAQILDSTKRLALRNSAIITADHLIKSL